MHFTLRFETDNAAFGDSADERANEIARILRGIADKLYADSDLAGGDHEGVIRDLNGNTVGLWRCVSETN